MLAGSYKLSRKEAQRLLEDLFGVKLSLGALSSLGELCLRWLVPLMHQANGDVNDALDEKA